MTRQSFAYFKIDMGLNILISGNRFLRRDRASGGRTRSPRHALQARRAILEEGEAPQTPRLRHQQGRSRAHLGYGRFIGFFEERTEVNGMKIVSLKMWFRNLR